MFQTQRTPLAAGVLFAAFLLTLAGRASRAQSIPACPPPQVGAELRDIPSLYATNGLLSTTFTVELKRQCVPVFASQTWSSVAMNLRTYVYSNSAGQVGWGFPGPTLHLRKPSSPYAMGDSLAILLVNNLPPEVNSTTTPCDSACPTGTVCPTDPSQLPNPNTSCPGDPLCCCWVDRSQTAPNCFHGDNTTNLHFHGTHVSPQPPQDYVLLELRPNQTTTDPAPPPAHDHGIVAYGQYQYKVDPLLFTQSEGTFWYHPHKHGSVSVQLANGMPGALLIEGPFDDWLRAFYQNNLKEKLLVLQQVQEKTNLYGQGQGAPALLVNGQASPVITMAPGEVQRWRFLNATLQASAQVSLYFPAQAAARQIAMDGIQFAPENYRRQPLFSPSNPSAFQISPGNRADFLVQAPTIAGTFPLSYEVFGNLGELAPQTVRQSGLGGGGGARPPLVTLVVQAPAKGATQTVATGLPTPAQWPPLPSYLSDIGDNEIQARESLLFSMTAGAGNPTTKFLINGKQFSSSCDDVTTKLGTAEEWTVSNSSGPQHPFHIHTNPFQLLRNGSTTYTAPWVWMDTIALPVGTPQTQSVLLRQRYTDFTGGYVLHCHFLGHEDRGMMFGVQTVCPQDPSSYGKARPGGAPECVSGNFIPAMPICPSITTAAAGSK